MASSCPADAHVWIEDRCIRCGKTRDSGSERGARPIAQRLRDLFPGMPPQFGPDPSRLERQPGHLLPTWLDTAAAGGIEPKDLKPLLAALCNSWVDAGEAARAATALGAIGGPDAVTHLLKALTDKEGIVRQSAAEALGKLRDPRSVEPLIRSLDDRAVTETAAAALAASGDRKAVEPLVKMLRHSVPAARRAAAEALAKLGDPRAVEPFIATLGDGAGTVRRAVVDGLAKLADSRAVEPLIEALTDADPSFRRSVADALFALGEVQWRDLVLGEPEDFVRLAASGDPRGAACVIKALSSELAWVRLTAANALGQLRDSRALEPLIARLGDRDDSVGMAAVAALGRLGDSRTLAPLTKALGNGSRGVRRTAFETIAALGDSRAVEPMILALADGDDSIRRAAAERLGELGDSRAVERLLQALGDTAGEVRRAAAAALKGLGETRWQDLVHGEPEDFSRLADSDDSRAVEPLIMALRDRSSAVRRAAAEGLGRLGDPRAVDPLIGALSDAPSEARSATTAALERIGAPAVEPLAKVLGGSSSKLVLEVAAETLGRIGDVRAVEPLARALLTSPIESVLKKVARALVKLGAPALESLLNALQEGQREPVLQAATEALGELGDPRAVEPLLRTLEGSSLSVRVAAVTALGRLGDRRAVDPLVRMLDDGCVDVAKVAAEALGGLTDRRAVNPLIEALLGSERWLVRRPAAKSLGMLGDSRAVSPLIDALYDDEGNVREAAAEALRALEAWEKAEELMRQRPFAVRKLAAKLQVLDVVGPLDLPPEDSWSRKLSRVESASPAEAVASYLMDRTTDLVSLPNRSSMSTFFRVFRQRLPRAHGDPSVLEYSVAGSRKLEGDQLIVNSESLVVIRNGEDSYSVYRYQLHSVYEDRWV